MNIQNIRQQSLLPFPTSSPHRRLKFKRNEECSGTQNQVIRHRLLCRATATLRRREERPRRLKLTFSKSAITLCKIWQLPSHHLRPRRRPLRTSMITETSSKTNSNNVNNSSSSLGHLLIGIRTVTHQLL